MKKEIIITADGSHTIVVPGINITYHSVHGAIAESQHVFIDAGLHYLLANSLLPAGLSIFEMGFGTGLNALLTLSAAEKNKEPVFYETLEPFPLESSTFKLLNYCAILQRPGLQKAFEGLHECEWNKAITITPYFTFKKMNTPLAEYSGNSKFNLIYFDAFAPTVQPALWTMETFKKLSGHMKTNGVLVTYCSKSIVRKAMQQAGFTVIKIPGPHGKREMVRAIAV
jgi:tRNA U34 5-methylaminomethyl-2-thiouridine-forming methyltransferase MnmC